LGPSVGTVGAYEFDMLKKHESSATAEKKGAGCRWPEPGGNLE